MNLTSIQVAQPYWPIYIDSTTDLEQFIFAVFCIQNPNVNCSKKDFQEIQQDQYCILYDIIRQMLDYASGDGISVILESDYVDPVYRDSFYMHYAKKHFDYSRSCVRVSFFKGKIDKLFLNSYDSLYDRANLLSTGSDVENELEKVFLGFSVIRPLQQGKIGRTIITPCCMVDGQYNIRTSKYDCTIYGIRLYIDAFPFMMQDSETATCAEVSLLLLLDYYGKRYAEYRTAYASNVADVAGMQLYERSVPTHGLSYPVLTRVLKEFGFQPRLYRSNEIGIDLLPVIFSYVESAMPIAIGIDGMTNEGQGHSVVCIGHKQRDIERLSSKVYKNLFLADAINGEMSFVYLCDASDAYKDYIVMDDNKCPYQTISIEREGYVSKHKLVYKVDQSNSFRISNVAVPMHSQMDMEAHDALAIFRQILTSKFGLTAQFKSYTNEELSSVLNLIDITDGIIPGARADAPIVMRIFLSSTRSYKRFRRRENSSIFAASKYATLSLPRFIWVCEIGTLKSFENKQIIGEIILDATSSKNNDLNSIVLMQYPGTIATRRTNELNQRLINTLSNQKIIFDWKPYREFSFNDED